MNNARRLDATLTPGANHLFFHPFLASEALSQSAPNVLRQQRRHKSLTLRHGNMTLAPSRHPDRISKPHIAEHKLWWFGGKAISDEDVQGRCVCDKTTLSVYIAPTEMFGRPLPDQSNAYSIFEQQALASSCLASKFRHIQPGRRGILSARRINVRDNLLCLVLKDDRIPSKGKWS